MVPSKLACHQPTRLSVFVAAVNSKCIDTNGANKSYVVSGVGCAHMEIAEWFFVTVGCFANVHSPGWITQHTTPLRGGKMKILDLTAGNRAIWYNKNHPLAIYLDKRKKVKPDVVANSTKLPRKIGKNFKLIVYDPPHMNCGPNSNMSRVYGYHKTKNILRDIKLTGKEAHRVSGSGALMALKWNNHDISLKRVFELLPNWEPLFGHLTKDGPRSQTYWVMLRRLK